MATPSNGRISARRNPQFKRFLDVLARKDRRFVLVEGPKMLEEAQRSGLEIDVLAVDESKTSAATVEMLKKEAGSVLHVTGALLREISDVETSQGIAALVRRPESSREWLQDPRAIVLILDRVQDPGNLGTLFRSAEATGLSGVLLTKGSADPLSPKALRASAGSALRLPHVAGLSAKDALSLLSPSTALIAAVADARAASVFEFPAKPPIAIALGSEGSGLDALFMNARNSMVRIPHARDVESLNVAVAGSILMFEIARRCGLLEKPAPIHSIPHAHRRS